MPALTVSIPHQLGRAEAKRRMQEHILLLRKQHGSFFTDLQDTWTGDSLDFSATAMGQTVTGRMTVDDQVLHLNVNLPWMLSVLAGPIKRQLEQQGKDLLKLPSK